MEKKKIMIIGSLHYDEIMKDYKKSLEMLGGYEVKLPAGDDHHKFTDALDLIISNIEKIKWADEVHMFWNGRSIGTVADWQTAVALDKVVVPVYIEEKFTYQNAMKIYKKMREII